MGKHRVQPAAAAAVLMCLAAAGATGPATAEEERNPREERERPGEDTSGRVQRGEAS
jgi:rare lipoprotein A